MSTRTTVCLMWLVVSLGMSVSRAADPGQPFLPPGVEDRGWPFVRGPNFDAHSPEVHIADEWPQNGPPVLWTRTLGQGYSAFVAHGDHVYTQAQTLSGQYVECLDADSGESVWSYRYDWPYEAAGVYPGPRATPTFVDGFIYFASPAGQIGCLAAKTGDLVWSRNVIEDYGGTGGVGFGYACSPLVLEGRVILPVGGPGASLVALDAITGAEVWASGDDPASYSPAFPIDHDGRKLIVGYFQNSLNLFDRLTGEQLGRLDLSAGYDEHSAWPIFHAPHLWISAPFRAGSQLLQIPDLASPDADEESRTFQTVWKKRLLSNDVTSSVLVDGHVYGFDLYDAQSKVHRLSRGKFLCIDFLTGEEKWAIGTGRIKRENSDRPQSDEPEIGQSGIIAVDGKLLIFNEAGELILARPNPDRYEELARTSVLGGELVWTPPVLHRGRVYLRNHTRAVCVYVGDPQLLTATDQPVLTVADVPQDGYRDLASQLLSIEPEYAIDVPSREWLQRWYLVSMALLVASGFASLLIRAATPERLYRPGGRLPFRVIAFVAGAVGTTCLSHWSGEFIFTWPLCLFVCFDALGGDLRLTRRRTPRSEHGRSRWGEWLRAGVFLAGCLVYFLICWRLSLIFEWAYLTGFPAAVPFSWLAARLRNRTGPLSVPTEAILTLAGYTAFHFSVVTILAIRFP